MLNSNVQPMIDDPEFFNTYVEKMPKGMKRKSIFYELPYWEHLNISHLLDPMHNSKKIHVLCGIKCHPKKVTNCLLGNILFLQILKRSIGQDKKLERLAPLFHFKKVMSHGF